MNPTLTELVAKACWPKNPKTLQLEPHRRELLQLRRAGASIAAINAGLLQLGVEISDEALRLWFKARRRKPAGKRDAGARRECITSSPISPVLVAASETLGKMSE